MYNSRYLAAQYPIEVTEWEGKNAKTVPSGWVIIVQDPYEAAIGGTLMQLRDQLISSGIAALGVIGVVIMGLWWFVVRMLEEPVRWRPATVKITPSTAETLPLRHEET